MQKILKPLFLLGVSAGSLVSKKIYPRCSRVSDIACTRPARASCEASHVARVGQPDPLAARA
jgi:hypothetical protein